MVALTQKLAQGLVLSLSLSSSIFLASNAQTTTAGTNSTTSKPTTTQTAATPTSTIAAPPGFLGVASAANSNYIYYQGGQVNSANTTYTNELWSLDLTKSWPISNPAWTNLTTPRSGNVYGPATKGHSATMSTDGNTLLVTAPNTNGPFLLQYNIAAGSWSGVNSPTAQATLWSTRTSASFVTDSNSASWLIGGSYSDGTSTNEIDKFEDGVWNPALPLSPASGSSVLSSFNSGTAELYKNKIYIFGGISSTSGQRSYQSFQAIPYIDISTDKPTSGIQYALGSVPPPRQQHCSVLTDSEKVIIYGGYDATNKVSLSDMWSLDLVTWTWTLLLPQTQTSSRYGHTCNIAGANMVVFGGAAVSAGQTGQTGYVKDVQVYDVMLTRWMTSYAPKQDTTPITSASSAGSSGSGGLGVGPIVGIIIGVLVVVGCGLGLLIYKRRQKRIEIREAELEKEAYLASLRPEGGSHSKVSSPSAAHIGGQSTSGMSHDGFNGMDELLLSNAAGSPGHGQGNVQYLMQHLPDGTIAVQPVYFDHQAISSPNMGDEGGYVSPMASATHGGAAAGGGGAYFAPPPAQTPQVTYPQPSHDPFASPVMPNVPLPPGYNPGNSGVGSPQQMPEQLR